MERFLETGQIVSTHGVKGTVRVQPWADSPKSLTQLPCVYIKKGNDYLPFPILKASVQGNMVLLTLQGCTSLEDAMALKNTILYADRANIPLKEGDYFIADLIGLPVIDFKTKKCYGTISRIYNRGASDIYEIEMPNKKIAYLPAVKEFVTKTDLNSAIYVTPIPGIFDEWGE